MQQKQLHFCAEAAYTLAHYSVCIPIHRKYFLIEKYLRPKMFASSICRSIPAMEASIRPPPPPNVLNQKYFMQTDTKIECCMKINNDTSGM
jgi:hypothetical protein